MAAIVRIAICQLSCHPAIYSGQQMWLEEPFIPENKSHTLSYLSIQGFRVEHLLDYCKKTYIQWHTKRIRALLKMLHSLAPPPTIVLFSEGSIPYQCLEIVHEYSASTETSVFAGTHSLQKVKGLMTIYKSLGVKEKTIQRLFCKKQPDVTGVAPIFIGDKVHMLRKKILSPFESTDISPLDVPSQPYAPIQVPVGEKRIPVLPMICSEALNFTKMKIKGDYALAVILSCDRKPSQFDSVIQMLVTSKKAVVYCNDGGSGSSSVMVPIDKRRSIWWFDSSLKGHLPKGDAVLVADIDLHNLGVQVGVSDPSKNFVLTKVCSVTYSEDPSHSSVSRRMQEIRSIEDSLSRSNVMEDFLARLSPNELQKLRISYLKHLAKTGQDSEDWWDAIGTDWILNLPSLHQIESELAKYCYGQLSGEWLDHDQTKAGIEELRGFLKLAKTLGGEKDRIQAFPQTEGIRAKSIINRDEDVKAILSFLDNPKQHVAQISGLQEIGKSSVVEKALTLYQYSHIIELQIFPTTSADYIVRKLLPHLFSDSAGETESLAAQVTEDDFVDGLDRTDLLLIYNSEQLVQRNKWKNVEIAHTINQLIKAVVRTEGKIIFETRKELPLDLADPSIFYRKRIYGLEKRLRSHGVIYLDYQIRRVGMSPRDFDDERKEKIVDTLGGHPVALALCADAIYDQGISSVMELLKKKKGFYSHYVKAILSNIDLGDEERTILNLLSGCRLAVPREAILGTFDKPVAPHLRHLIQLCMIEVGRMSNIRLPGLLLSYFDIEEIPPETRKKFHLLAAECYTRLWTNNKTKLECAIEADYHASLGGAASRLSGKLIDSQMAIAESRFRSQDYKGAKRILDQISSKKPTHDILRLSALADAKCNEFDLALDKAKRLFRANPSDTWLLSEIARTALSQRRDDIAGQLIAIAKVANMEDTAIHIVSGRMLLRQGDLPGAEEHFEKACKLTRSTAWPYYYLGKTRLLRGEIDEAVDAFCDGENFIYDKSIRNVKVLTAIRTQMGIAYLLLDRIDLAKPILEGLFADETSDPEVMRAYAFLCLKTDGIETAHEAYKRLSDAKIRSRYDRAQYHLFYGLFYLGLEDKGNASREFSKAHREDKNNVYVMVKLARVYYDMAMDSWIDGDLGIAKTYANDCGVVVKKILEFDSDNDVAKHLQIELYEKFDIELSKL